MRKNPFLLTAAILLFVQPVFAALYPFEIFSENGSYWNHPGINIFMDVFSSNNGDSTAMFTFYNNSTIDCVVTRIYFDDDNFLEGSALNIINGPGTLFDKNFPGPGNIPGGNEIDFTADKQFNVGARSPSPENGINSISAGETVTLEFELSGGGLQDILNELDNGDLRVAVHIMSFPDGSSNGAVNVPEPATLCLLGLGGLLFGKRKKA
ncbi:MAG: PEP-CTERM sorting domain-containing protein [Sedimentisphaerales bacterium]|nr:PEP-CTERM sorting domain-containing protein [Sedimentisphaerales bacterium]